MLQTFLTSISDALLAAFSATSREEKKKGKGTFFPRNRIQKIKFSAVVPSSGKLQPVGRFFPPVNQDESKICQIMLGARKKSKREDDTSQLETFTGKKALKLKEEKSLCFFSRDKSIR